MYERVQNKSTQFAMAAGYSHRELRRLGLNYTFTSHELMN